ncbi:MAG: type II secretion system F family protein [Puniceicoccales bacterium]|jgi:hypothetical protein|nr:type II secretion system F family protein [Puniceicoccales bacterium]
MKFRRFLRNSFQNTIDKYQEFFFKDSEKKADSTPEEPENEDALEDDFRIPKHLFKAMEQQQIDDNLGQQIHPFTIDAMDIAGSDLTSIASAMDSASSPKTVTANLGADFAAIYDGKLEQVSVAPKIGKRNEKSYSYRPKKSKTNEKVAEKSAKQKKRAGSLNLKIEKKAQIVNQLAILLDSGMDLRSSLAILEEQETRNKNIWLFIHDLFMKIEAGDSFSEALMSSIVKFDESEIAMIRAGEAVGKLSDTLSKMASLIEKKVRIKKKSPQPWFIRRWFYWFHWPLFYC